MAIYRKISVTFWGDSYVQKLKADEKCFYLYLMTNHLTRQCGIYEISIDQMCFDTRFTEKTVLALLEKFELAGKVAYSRGTSEIALRNWKKYNYSDSPKVKACIQKELLLVKNKGLIQYVYSIDTQTQEEKEQEQEETEEQTPEEGADALVHVWPTFDDFWNLYNHKHDRPKCEKLWKKIKQGAREKIMQHAQQYVGSTPDKTYRKYPATYLRNESWENEIVKPIMNGNHVKGTNGTTSAQIAGTRYTGSKL